MPKQLCDFFTWALNQDGTISDDFRNEMQVIPTGSIMWYLSSVIPSGWLEANGQEISRETYPLLFSLLGTKYGAGNGTTTFLLPDLRDSFIMGRSATRAIGDTGGEADHLLTGAESGTSSHTHTISQIRWSNSNGFTDNAGGGTGTTGAFTPVTDNSAAANALQAHNNLPPFFVAVPCIKA